MRTNILDMHMLLKQPNAENFQQDETISAQLESQQGGNGNILQISAGAGVECFLFNLCFEEDTILRLSEKQADSIQLFYVVKGGCCYLKREWDRSVFFDHFQTNVNLSKDKKAGNIHVAGGQQAQLLLTTLNVEKFTKKYPYYQGLLGNIEENLSDSGSTEDFFHKSAHNLCVSELIKGLFPQKFESNIIHGLNTEITCKKILAIQLEQLRSENNGETKRNDLSVREMQRIVELVDYINKNLEQTHNVMALSRETGLSPNKLQLGFKTIYGHTVSDYIRNLRLERAECLIRTTDMNISEVVYTIGLTSRSYFCKIFKRRFNCAPKQYKNMVWKQPIKKAAPKDPLFV